MVVHTLLHTKAQYIQNSESTRFEAAAVAELCKFPEGKVYNGEKREIVSFSFEYPRCLPPRIVGKGTDRQESNIHHTVYTLE